MMIIRGVNDALAFLLEIAMLAAFAWWGFTTGSPAWVSVVLGTGLVVAAIAIWGLLVAPRAPRRLHDPWHTLLTLALLGSAAVALSVTANTGLALAFGALVVLNQVVKRLVRR